MNSPLPDVSVVIPTYNRLETLELVKRGEEILQVRDGHETEVMAGWSPTGR